MERANLRPDDVDCVYADGSAVPREDAAEVLALSAVFDGAAPVTTAKPSVGHLMGAATAAEVAVALKGFRAGRIPPVANLDAPASGFDLDFVVGTPRETPGMLCAAVVARGLGGVNACLVLTH